MHQPYYKNLRTGTYLLPWVLLHGTKDYYDMAYILREFEGIKQTFNLVPSLLIQLSEYAQGTAKDIYLDLFRKDAADLSEEERSFLLVNFFSANWEHMIRAYPRYAELLRKRGFYYAREEVQRIARSFTDQDLRDLQVLFFLSWIDPIFFERFEELKELKRKGRNFKEEDKRSLEGVQREILSQTIPLYRELFEKGTIELSTSPFFHPILPLLIDTEIARVSMPERALPRSRFSHPEDASGQIRMAIELFSSLFGRRPKGMWPPEGSVSDDALRMLIAHGIEWTATDEEILFLTMKIEGRRDEMGYIHEPDLLYRGYRYVDGEREIRILFRDKYLSDLISFRYARMDAKDAARDFIQRLRTIAMRLEGRIRRPVVAIIMDGENAWEYYKNDGRDFLSFLYEGILKEPTIRCVTVSEHFSEERELSPIFSIYPGSWISHNFSIWIGHIEDNTGWELLHETRRLIGETDPEGRNTMAWQCLYAAEGSDWFWWYGDEHASENDEVFDFLFRENLSNVYRFLRLEPPEILSVPIMVEEREVAPTRQPLNFISPRIDGYVTDYFEWLGAGFLEGKTHGVAMHETAPLIRGLHFGFDISHLYLRMDVDTSYLKAEEPHLSFEINLLTGKEEKILYDPKEGIKEEAGRYVVSFVRILEAKISLASVCAGPGDSIRLSVSVKIKGFKVDRIPKRGLLSISVPTEEFEREMWYV